jgi:hypothetical protein
MAPDGSVSFVRVQTHRRTVEREDEAFFLRISKEGDYFYEGADLGILITPGRLMNPEFELLPRAKKWIDGIRAHYETRSLAPAQSTLGSRATEVGNFKML